MCGGWLYRFFRKYGIHGCKMEGDEETGVQEIQSEGQDNLFLIHHKSPKRDQTASQLAAATQDPALPAPAADPRCPAPAGPQHRAHAPDDSTPLRGRRVVGQCHQPRRPVSTLGRGAALPGAVAPGQLG